MRTVSYLSTCYNISEHSASVQSRIRQENTASLSVYRPAVNSSRASPRASKSQANKQWKSIFTEEPQHSKQCFASYLSKPFVLVPIVVRPKNTSFLATHAFFYQQLVLSHSGLNKTQRIATHRSLQFFLPSLRSTPQHSPAWHFYP